MSRADATDPSRATIAGVVAIPLCLKSNREQAKTGATEVNRRFVPGNQLTEQQAMVYSTF